MGEEGGGGGRQRFIFYTQKNHNFRICLPKKITTFYSIPKKIPSSFFFCNPKKSLCFFLQHKKILASFLDPKKSLLAKISDPKKIMRTTPSLKYVSGVPGWKIQRFFSGNILLLPLGARWLHVVKTPTNTPFKLPQFISYYKRTKPKFAKPPPTGACSIDKSPLMPHQGPTFPKGGEGVGFCIE